MNKDRLKQLADHLKKEGERTLGFNMAVYYTDLGPLVMDYSGQDCDTVACIAGHAVALFNGKESLENDPDLNIPELSRELLGLDRLQGDKLFTPCQSTGAYDATPEQAAAAVRNMALLGEPRWEEVMKDGL